MNHEWFVGLIMKVKLFFFWCDAKHCIQVEKKTHQEKILAMWAVGS